MRPKSPSESSSRQTSKPSVRVWGPAVTRGGSLRVVTQTIGIGGGDRGQQWVGIGDGNSPGRCGAHVVMAARDRARTEEAQREIHAEHTEAFTEYGELDLAALKSVRLAAEKILASHPRVDILINNAGVMAMPQRRTEDGFEMQFGVNHEGRRRVAERSWPFVPPSTPR